MTTEAPEQTALPPSARPGAGRVAGADGLRAFAALWVVASHLFQRLLLPAQEPWLQDVQLLALKGPFGVSIFFVLSGTLLSLPFWNAYLTGAARPGLRHYVRRRVARIVPGFYLSLLVSFAVGLWLVPDAEYRIQRLLAGLTFTSGFHWVTLFPVPLNGPLWSIGFEVVSYVLMPLAMVGLFAWRGRSSGRAVGYWLAVLGVVLAVNQWIITALVPSDEGRGWQFGDLGGAKEWMPAYNPVGFFAHFCLGIAAAGAIAWWRVRRDGRPHWGFDGVAALALGAGAVVVWCNREPVEPQNAGNVQGQPYLWPVVAGLAALALVGLAHSRVLGRLVDNRPARYVARISFGIYVWHYLIIECLARATDGELVYFGVADPGRHLVLSGVVVGLTFVVASASWRWLERPVLESRWATGRSDAPAVSRVG